MKFLCVLFSLQYSFLSNFLVYLYFLCVHPYRIPHIYFSLFIPHSILFCSVLFCFILHYFTCCVLFFFILFFILFSVLYCTTLFLGIHIFATGGIGGVHRGAETSMDISADLTELGRTPVTVVCAGVKSILDIRKTLEVLETQGMHKSKQVI